jgi:hypothetical protein
MSYESAEPEQIGHVQLPGAIKTRHSPFLEAQFSRNARL